jgi:hypothetical protein
MRVFGFRGHYLGAGGPFPGEDMSDNNDNTITPGGDRERGFSHRVHVNLDRDSNGLSLSWNWAYFIIKLATAVFTVLALAEAATAIYWILAYDNRELATYITNTFYTTNDNEGSMGWQVLTSPSWSGISRTAPYSDVKFEQYYECMWTAQVASATCNNATVDAYKTCMVGAYAHQLATCASGQPGTSWPTANAYTACIITNFNPGNRTALNSMKKCVGQNLWPLYEQPQDIDTEFFLGAFSWPLLLVTGFFLFVVFGAYTFWPIDWEDTVIIEHGKAGKTGEMGFARLGVFWTLIPLAGAVAWAAITLIIAFRSGGAWPNNYTNAYPSTQTTNVVAVTASFGVLFYFLLELAEFSDRTVRTGKLGERPTLRSMFASIPQIVYMPGKGQPNSMGYVFPDPTHTHTVDSITKSAELYTPVLLNTWSDAYLLDILFFVGAVGGTQQVITSEIYNLFWGLVYYRVAHMGVARMVYQSFVRSPTESAAENRAKDGGEQAHSHLAMRVLGLSLHMAAVVALYIVCNIIFNPNRMFTEYPNLTTLVTLGLLVPEAIRFFGHLFLTVSSSDREGRKGVYILICANFLWMWDLLIRAIFLVIFIWGDSSIRGTKPFLVSRLQNLTDTLAVMAY